MNRKPRRISAFLLWSVLVHVVVFASLYLRRAPVWTPPAGPVEVEFKTADDELRPAKPVKPAEPRRQKQIVEQEHALNDEVDPNTRFLSAFNQKVVQETRAEQSGRFNNQVHGNPDGARGAENAKPAAAKKPAAKSRAKGEMPSLADLLPKYEVSADRSPAAYSPSEAPNGDPTRSDDYLKDVKPGLQTLISTREFVYYAYYNRIKTALRARWEPEVRERVNIVLRQGRNIAAAQDRVTQVVVTLDARGELLNVDVINQSGVADLDAAAVQAFREAAPFPNPPRGMLEVDGTVKIRWDFVLEV